MCGVDVDRVDSRDRLNSSTLSSRLASVGVDRSLHAKWLHEASHLEVEPPDFVALSTDDGVAGREVVGECSSVSRHSHAVVGGRLRVQLY